MVDCIICFFLPLSFLPTQFYWRDMFTFPKILESARLPALARRMWVDICHSLADHFWDVASTLYLILLLECFLQLRSHNKKIHGNELCWVQWGPADPNRTPSPESPCDPDHEKQDCFKTWRFGDYLLLQKKLKIWMWPGVKKYSRAHRVTFRGDPPNQSLGAAFLLFQAVWPDSWTVLNVIPEGEAFIL